MASAIWMPGRVGLVAVDALALNLPVCTTSYAFHAPELDFLQPGEVFVLSDEPAAYAQEALDVMDGPRPIARDDFPSIESVSRNFVNVVTNVLPTGGTPDD